MTLQESPLALKLGAFVALSADEIGHIQRFQRNQRVFAAGSDLVHEGQSNPPAYVLADGWASSYKMLRNGGRQIVDFQLPGDFMGLRSVLFRTSDHHIEPVTRIVATELVAADLITAFNESPRIAAAVLWAESSAQAIVVERLVSLGRRDAAERMIHFLLELWTRLRLVGLAEEKGYPCPLSQYHLADALGLSAVHVNRILRQLREESLLTFRNGEVVFHDFDALVRAADFNADYLDYGGPVWA